MHKKYPSNGTRRRFQTARVKLGLSPNSTGLIDWARLNKRTTFIWKHDTLEATARWVIEATRAAYAKHPHVDRAQIALHYIQKGFGIMPSDILDDQRNQVLIIPRYIAIVLVWRSGITRNETARRFKRDHTSVILADEKVGHLFEGIQDVENSVSERPASDGQPAGQVPA